LKVYSCWGGKRTLLGTVKQMLETGANDVMVVQPCEGSVDKRERLLPYLPGHYDLQVDVPAACLSLEWDPDF
jgi:16S rRNA processing protein RimM